MNSQYLWIVPILCLLFCVSCATSEKEHLFTSELDVVTFHRDGGIAINGWWVLKFVNGNRITIHQQGVVFKTQYAFIEGMKYNVYKQGNYFIVEEK